MLAHSRNNTLRHRVRRHCDKTLVVCAIWRVIDVGKRAQAVVDRQPDQQKRYSQNRSDEQEPVHLSSLMSRATPVKCRAKAIAKQISDAPIARSLSIVSAVPKT